MSVQCIWDGIALALFSKILSVLSLLTTYLQFVPTIWTNVFGQSSFGPGKLTISLLSLSYFGDKTEEKKKGFNPEICWFSFLQVKNLEHLKIGYPASVSQLVFYFIA